jgi:hypothetical protein
MILLLISIVCFDIGGVQIASDIMNWVYLNPFWTAYVILGMDYNLIKWGYYAKVS